MCFVALLGHRRRPPAPDKADPANPPPPGGADPVAAPHDWPMFHGNPALDGVTAASVPDQPALLWTFKAEGAIKGSAAIAGGRVFFGSQDSHVYALNLKDGSKLWQFKTESSVESTPCVVGDVLFVGSGDQRLYALDTQTGAVRWRYETLGEIKAGPNYVSRAALGQPPQDRQPSGYVIIGSYDNKLHCVDAASGDAAWTVDTGNYVNGSAAISGTRTVFGGCDARLHIVDLKTGTQAAKVETGAYIAASAAVRDGVAYVGNYEHELLAIDLQKASIVWSFKSPYEFPFFSSPAVAADRLVIGGDDKRVHCLDRATGKVLWAFVARGKIGSSPAIARDKVLVGSDDGRVYMLALQDGKELWAYEIGASVDGSPAVTDGLFVIGTGDGGLYAFGAK
jgi:outer membrane protein assembly factor BamB